MSRKVHVAIFWVGHETEEATAFLEALDAEGIESLPLDQASSTAALVVIITSDKESALPETVLIDREVLPVTFIDVFSGILPELSHLAPRSQGVESAARTLARTVMFGGTTLAEWERLNVAARAWEQSRDTKVLLTESEVFKSRALLARPPSQFRAETIVRVRAYIDASQSHTRRLRHRWRSLLGAAVTILILFTVVASVQVVSASNSARVSTEAANVSDARRLVTEASSALGRDPDLPLMLASIASELSDDSDVQHAVAEVAARQIAHSSRLLPAIPMDISASPVGAVSYRSFEDNLIRVVDSSGTDLELGSAERQSGWGRIFISLNGDHVAAVRVDEPPTIFQTNDNSEGKAVPGWEAPSEALLGWWDDRALLAAGESGLVSFDIATGKSEVVLDTASAAEAGHALKMINLAQLSSDRSVVAVTDGRVVQSWDLVHGILLGSAEYEGAGSLAVSDSGRVVFVTDGEYVTRLDFSESGEEIKRDQNTEIAGTTSVVALGDGYFGSAHTRGQVSVYISHTHAGALPISTFLAHRFEPVYIDANGASQFSTVSRDGYLRVWQLPDPELLGNFTPAGIVDSSSATIEVFDTEATLDAAYPAATFRNQIRMSSSEDVVAAFPARGAFLSEGANPTNILHAIGMSEIGLEGRMLITADGNHAVRTRLVDPISRNFILEIWPTGNPSSWQVTPENGLSIQLPLGPTGPAPFLVDVAADGTVGVATTQMLSSFDAQGDLLFETENYRSASPPLAVSANFNNAVVAVTDDGMLHIAGSEAVDLTRLLNAHGTVISAAEFAGDTLWSLTSDGAIYEITGGFSELEARPLAPVGTVSGPGTLRFSDVHRQLAHVGAAAVTVLSTHDGSVIAEQSVPLDVSIDDVEFVRTPKDGFVTLLVMTEIGTIARWELNPTGDPVRLAAPREPTAAESLAFNLARDNHG